MYDELIKKIRHCATDPMHCLSCAEDKDGRCFKRLMTQAADAIEELSRENESLAKGGGMSMRKTDDPCSICENYSTESGFICDFSENCPVAVMKRRNEILISNVASLRRRLDRMKSDASWDEDIRRGQVQGMW